MKIRLKEEALQELLNSMDEQGFSSGDGCACGDYGYKLSDDLYLYVYRSCRKSSFTPNDKLWNVGNIEFYKKAEFDYANYDGKRYLDAVEVEEEDLLENTKIDEYQGKLIIGKLRDITKNMWGSEYRD